MFEAYPVGFVVFANEFTGEVDLQQTPPGTYTITNTLPPNSGCDAVVAEATLEIYEPTTFNIFEQVSGSIRQYVIEEAEFDPFWRDEHSYQWRYIDSKDDIIDVTDFFEYWKTQWLGFPDFLSGNVTNATLIIDVSSNTGCLTRTILGKQEITHQLRKEAEEKRAAPGTVLETSFEEIGVYPVPARDQITIEVPFEGESEIVLRSMHGVDVGRLSTQARTAVMDVSKMPSGVYILSISHGNKTIFKKVEIVQ
jgi:hypothetical protein